MEWIQTLAAEFSITVLSVDVWAAIAVALGFAIVSTVAGVVIARIVGFLDSDVPAAETLAVGLGVGLVVLTSWWSSIASRGRSSFTPVAVGFAVALGLALVRRVRRARRDRSRIQIPSEIVAHDARSTSTEVRRFLPAILGGAAIIIATALLYGSTMVLKPRDGAQPIEFMDVGFYSVLGSELARTGEESVYPPSGFANLSGLTDQTWYHWGEIWLAAAFVQLFAFAPLVARHFIVLPVVLLAAAAITGTVVRRVARTRARGPFLLGFFACLLLAPVSISFGPGASFFSHWATGLIFGITLYGLAAVAVVLAMYAIAVLSPKLPDPALVVFAATAFAFLLPAHLVIAVLALVGVGGAWCVHVGHTLVVGHRLPSLAPVWRYTIAATGVAIALTVVWGLLTSHGVGASGVSESVTPFNASWRESVAATLLGAGALLAIPVAWILVRDDEALQMGMYVGTGILLLAGGLVWGARLGDYNMFHAYFGGIALFAIPVAAIALHTVWVRFRASGRRLLALATVLICVLQIETGMGLVILRLQGFGPGTYAPVPLEFLDQIRGLPGDAKLAYSCQPAEEVSFWESKLLGVTAHTGRPMVPMCFQSETLVLKTGTPTSPDRINPLFRSAPQQQLYPNATARPSHDAIVTFLRANGIQYIYADGAHPNELDPEATPVAQTGQFHLLKIP